MIKQLFTKPLETIYEHFKADPAKMLIITGCTGWILSSLAQISGILFNDKISNDQKSYMIPQEVGDALANIVAYLCITLSVKKLTTTLFKTGKFAPQKVRNFLESNENLKQKVGKLDFDVETALKDNPTLQKEFNQCKSFGTTLATVGAGIISTNIVTPLVRNRMASNVYQSYMNEKNNINEAKKSVQINSTFYPENSNGMRI